MCCGALRGILLSTFQYYHAPAPSCRYGLKVQCTLAVDRILWTIARFEDFWLFSNCLAREQKMMRKMKKRYARLADTEVRVVLDRLCAVAACLRVRARQCLRE